MRRCYAIVESRNFNNNEVTIVLLPGKVGGANGANMAALLHSVTLEMYYFHYVGVLLELDTEPTMWLLDDLSQWTPKVLQQKKNKKNPIDCNTKINSSKYHKITVYSCAAAYPLSKELYLNALVAVLDWGEAKLSQFFLVTPQKKSPVYTDNPYQAGIS